MCLLVSNPVGQLVSWSVRSETTSRKPESSRCLIWFATYSLLQEAKLLEHDEIHEHDTHHEKIRSQKKEVRNRQISIFRSTSGNGTGPKAIKEHPGASFKGFVHQNDADQGELEAELVESPAAAAADTQTRNEEHNPMVVATAKQSTTI